MKSQYLAASAPLPAAPVRRRSVSGIVDRPVSSTTMAQVRQLADVVATSSLTVLLLGGPGVGKERLATAIHEASPRRAAPLVKLDCASLTDLALDVTASKRGRLDAA